MYPPDLEKERKEKSSSSVEVEVEAGTLEEVEVEVRGSGFGLLRLRLLRKVVLEELFMEVGDTDIPNGMVRISWTLCFVSLSLSAIADSFFLGVCFSYETSSGHHCVVDAKIN